MPRISPYQATIAMLVQIFQEYQEQHGQEKLLNDKIWFELSSFLMAEIGALGSNRSENLTDLISRLQETIQDSQVVIKRLLDRLDSISSVDALEDIVSLIESTLVSPSWDEQEATSTSEQYRISRDSSFGLFLRSMIVSYHNLLFEGVSRLYTDMVEFYQTFKSGQDECLPSFDISNISNVAQELTFSGLSAKQVDTVLEETAQSIGTSNMIETERLLQALMHFKAPKIHFVRYLNFKHHREFQKALDCLHQYHDYSFTHPAMDDSKSYQYASLNLAALHFEFEQYPVAMTALQESIRLAHQYGDHICVSFAVSWLMRLFEVTKDTKAHDLIEDCLRKSKQLKLPVVHTLAVLSSCERQLVGEVKSNAIEVWRTLQESIENTVKELSATPLTNIPTQGMVAGANAAAKGSLESEQDSKLILQSRNQALRTIQRLNGKVHLMRACSWQLYGHRSLEEIYSRIFLSQYESDASAQDIAKALGRVAQLEISGSTNAKVVYIAALRVLLREGKSTRVYENVCWMQAVVSVLQTWAVARGEIKRGRVLTEVLLGLSSSKSDPYAYLEAQLHHLQLLRVSGHITDALELVKELSQFCETRELKSFQAHIHLFHAHLVVENSSTYPTSAVPVIMQCISLGRELDLDSVVATAQVYLAMSFLDQGFHNKACDLIQDSLPHIMEHCSLATQGLSLIVMAECKIQVKSNGRKDLKPALILLERALEVIEPVEELKLVQAVWYWRAIVFNELGRMKDRDESSKRFLETNQLLKASADREVVSLGLFDTPSQVVQNLSAQFVQ